MSASDDYPIMAALATDPQNDVRQQRLASEITDALREIDWLRCRAGVL